MTMIIVIVMANRAAVMIHVRAVAGTGPATASEIAANVSRTQGVALKSGPIPFITALAAKPVPFFESIANISTSAQPGDPDHQVSLGSV